MNNKTRSAADALREAVARCSVSDIKAALAACDDVLLDDDTYPDELFTAVIDVLQSKAFGACAKSWLVLHHLYQSGAQLTGTQKTQLAPVVAAKYESGGEKGPFMIAVLLGEVCRDASALERLAATTGTRALREIALDALASMRRRGTA
jgi:hypothetical protein